MNIASDLVPTGCDGKADTNKTRMSLLTGQFRCALVGVARILTFGAKKYPHPESGDRSWLTVPGGIERYADAYERHMNEVYADIECFRGKDPRGFVKNTDIESGELHIDHAICNLLFLRTLLYGDKR